MNKKPAPTGPYKTIWHVSDVGYVLPDEYAFQPTEKGLTLIHAGIDGRRPEETEPSYTPDQILWMVIASEAKDGDQLDHLNLVYDPMEEPSLHRTFARLPLKAAAIVEFANTYGFLGRETTALERFPMREEGTPEPGYYGEQLEDWCTHIFKLQTLLKIWDCYQNPDPPSFALLSKILEIDDESIWIRQQYVSEVCDSYEGDTPSIDWDWDALETDISELPSVAEDAVRLRLGARLLIREAVNDELRLSTHALIDVKEGSEIYLVPTDLLGAIYIHFAKELVGRSTPTKQCRGCGSYFIPEHGRQIYCDERCKFKAYRQRKKEAENG
jgi:hypothetical protein